jgi:flagellar biosynthesis/type III secretory pathway protein FliH
MVRTENSQIDVRLDSRINAIIANALGEERAPERPTPDPGQIEE